VFEATRGATSGGDIAIDDILITDGKNCQVQPPEADPFTDLSIASCSFDKDLCNWVDSDQGMPQVISW